MAEQERAIRTRNAILLAAAVVFDERGFEAASIAEILSRAGVTKGGLYFHFPSKEALAEAVMAEQIRVLPDPVDDAPLQNVIDLTHHVAGQLQSNPLVRAGVRLALDQGSFGDRSSSAYQQWIDVLEPYLRQADEQGHLAPQADPQAVTELIVAAFTGVQLLSQRLSQHQDLLERLTIMWHHLLPGIAHPRTLPTLVVDRRSAIAGPAG